MKINYSLFCTLVLHTAKKVLVKIYPATLRKARCNLYALCLYCLPRYVVNESDLEKQDSQAEQNVGNVKRTSTITFEFAKRTSSTGLAYILILFLFVSTTISSDTPRVTFFNASMLLILLI